LRKRELLRQAGDDRENDVLAKIGRERNQQRSGSDNQSNKFERDHREISP
jgi:hypothetical protein